MKKNSLGNGFAVTNAATRCVSRREFLKGCGYVAVGIGAFSLEGIPRFWDHERGLVHAASKKPSSVGIVKAADHALVGESWQDPFTPFPKGEPPMKFWHPTWSKVSQVKIEEMVRQAVKAAGDWPVEKGDRSMASPSCKSNQAP